MKIFYWTRPSSEYVSGDPGFEGKTVQVVDKSGHTCDVELAESVETANNGSRVYKTRYDVASGKRRAYIRNKALIIAKKHAFGSGDNDLGDRARKAFDEADDPRLTPDQASDIIEELEELEWV